jgi:3-isopropylmalate/(R)-2-methylmalate dehydratase large subunit
MKPKTFIEKILGAPEGAVVFRQPDIILTHDNTSSIYQTFRKMGGDRVHDPRQMLVVLDHNAPPADARLATQYQDIRNIVNDQGIKRFYDSGTGICHQMMSYHARSGMIIVGSDSHTCTAGAFNALAAGIDRTEAAGIWKRGETWFLVPPSMRIDLKGRLSPGVSAKDLSLWIIGMIGSDGANYMSIEFHGEGVSTLNISERMTVANLASEMGAKNAVFPADEILQKFTGEKTRGVWADDDAEYRCRLSIDLSNVFPLVAAPHHVDNIRSIASVAGTVVHEGLIGTCTNGRIEDLRAAATVLRGEKIKKGFQLHIIPASKDIYLQAIKEGIIIDLIEAGANILTPSCGPCLGTGQGIPANDHTVISTANRNFLGRMGNKEASIYLASPATVASSALTGVITDPRMIKGKEVFPFNPPQSVTNVIKEGENRKEGNVWNYSDVDNLNTDQMFAGKHTYSIMSSDADAILPLLFADIDTSFSSNARAGDIIIAGDNFGCGSSREHPSVGLAHLGIRAVIIKSVNRIFYRSSINQGLPLIVHREAVEAYNRGDRIEINFDKGSLIVGVKTFTFEPLPPELKQIIEKKGLVNWIRTA